MLMSFKGTGHLVLKPLTGLSSSAKNFFAKALTGLSHEMGLAFDDMCG